jgi:hypothetical protein
VPSLANKADLFHTNLDLYCLGPFSSLMKAPRKSVAFSPRLDILPIDPRRRARNRNLNMEKQVYEKFDGSQVTESMLEEASQLFNEHYGVWGERAAELIGRFAKAGKLTLIHSFCLLRNTR